MRMVPIGDLVQPVEKRDPRTDSRSATFTYVDIGAVSQGTKQIEEPQEVVCSDAPSRARQVILADDILVSTVRPNLNAVARVAGQFNGAIASTGFSVLRPVPDKLCHSYLYHWVRTEAFINKMMMQATGQSYPAVSDKIVKASEIPLPPLEEQKRIAGILDQADALRRLRARALDKLRELPSSIFEEMFGDEKDVKWVCIEEVVTRLTNGYVGPTRGIYHEQGIPYLLARHIKNGSLKFDERTFISDAFNNKNRKSILKTGDVLLVQSGHIGSSAVVPEEHDGHNCHALIVITPKPDRITGRFLSALFATKRLEIAFKRIRTGQTIPHLNCRDVRKLEIPLPSISRQVQYTERLQAVDALVASQSKLIQEQDVLFSSLQHRAFRGDL